MIKFLFILFIIVGCSQNDSKMDMPSFNEQRAFQHLIDQCSYGPRNPGSLGYNNFSIYLEQYLKNLSSNICLLYTSPSPRDLSTSRMPSSA